MLDLRAEYVQRFALLPHVQVCEPHDGEFDLEEIARLGVARSPAVYVACMRSDELRDDTGATTSTLGWVAMVIARPADRVREGQALPGDLAALIALSIVAELHDGAPFAAARSRATRVRARNLHGARAAKRDVRIWGVEWLQDAEIGRGSLDEALHDLELVHTAYPALPDRAGEPTAIDADDLTEDEP